MSAFLVVFLNQYFGFAIQISSFSVMVMISNVNTFIPREWKDMSFAVFAAVFFL